MNNEGVVMKLVAIKPEQSQALKQLKRRHGITQTHVIREGIDLALEKYAHLLSRTSATRNSAKRELSE
jgi:hypothetical protein